MVIRNYIQPSKHINNQSIKETDDKTIPFLFSRLESSYLSVSYRANKVIIILNSQSKFSSSQLAHHNLNFQILKRYTCTILYKSQEHSKTPTWGTGDGLLGEEAGLRED